MAERLLKTANYWAEQLQVSDKEVRKALEGREPDGSRGETQPTWFLTTVFAALSGMESLDGSKERARKDKEAADKLALENAETRGDLAPISIMEDEVASLLGDHRTNVLGLPSKAAPLLVGLNADQIRERLEGFVFELLGDLADYRPGSRKGKRPQGAEPGESGSEASTEADR